MFEIENMVTNSQKSCLGFLPINVGLVSVKWLKAFVVTPTTGPKTALASLMNLLDRILFSSPNLLRQSQPCSQFKRIHFVVNYNANCLHDAGKY